MPTTRISRFGLQQSGKIIAAAAVAVLEVVGIVVFGSFVKLLLLTVSTGAVVCFGTFLILDLEKENYLDRRMCCLFSVHKFCLMTITICCI